MSESARTRLEQLKVGVEAFNRGDQDAVLAIFAPNVECHVARDLMNAGTWTGHDGYREMISVWGEAWGEIEIEIINADEPDPDHLLVEVDQRAVGAGSGVPVEMTLCWLFAFAGGLVVHFGIYPDRRAALAAVR